VFRAKTVQQRPLAEGSLNPVARLWGNTLSEN